MRITIALQKFLLQLQADGRSVFTIDQRRRHVLAFAAWIASAHRTRDLGKVTHEVVAAFMASPTARSRRDGGIKRATSTNQLRTSLRCFFGYCEDAGLVRQSPARLLKLARCSSAPPRTLSEKDCKRLMETLAADNSPLAQRDHMMFAIMLETGVRLSSALAIEHEDIDLDVREIRLRVGKGDRPEVVLFGRRLATHLRRYCKGRGPGPLFPGRRCRYLGSRHARARLVLWLKRASIDVAISPHALRHTFATRLYQRTGDVLLVKQALRHRSIGSTMAYARSNEAAVRAALR